MYNQFDARETMVIAVAQEDTDLESHSRFLRNFGDERRFEIVADINREVTTAYDRTTTYFIDKEGVVRQVFPQIIHARASWKAMLHEIDRLLD